MEYVDEYTDEQVCDDYDLLKQHIVCYVMDMKFEETVDTQYLLLSIIKSKCCKFGEEEMNGTKKKKKQHNLIKHVMIITNINNRMVMKHVFAIKNVTVICCVIIYV